MHRILSAYHTLRVRGRHTFASLRDSEGVLPDLLHLQRLQVHRQDHLAFPPKTTSPASADHQLPQTLAPLQQFASAAVYLELVSKSLCIACCWGRARRPFSKQFQQPRDCPHGNEQSRAESTPCYSLALSSQPCCSPLLLQNSFPNGNKQQRGSSSKCGIVGQRVTIGSLRCTKIARSGSRPCAAHRYLNYNRERYNDSRFHVENYIIQLVLPSFFLFSANASLSAVVEAAAAAGFAPAVGEVDLDSATESFSWNLLTTFEYRCKYSDKIAGYTTQAKSRLCLHCKMGVPIEPSVVP